jgi:hypothetical protein
MTNDRHIGPTTVQACTAALMLADCTEYRTNSSHTLYTSAILDPGSSSFIIDQAFTSASLVGMREQGKM